MIGNLMAKALQPAVKAGQIFFELDRFELVEGDRLELSGRWFGVRGRRFVRPSLALVSEGGPVRALADLEHKPWATEDGEPWDAAFPWRADVDVLEAELSVAPDIAVPLPAPGAGLDPAQRIAVLPRERGVTARPAASESGDPVPNGESKSTAPRPRARRSPNSQRPSGELDALRQEVAALRAELEKLRHELDAAQAASGESASAAAAAGVELAAAEERRDAAASGMQAAITARDTAARTRDDLAGERDRERRAREQLAAEKDRAERAMRRMGSELEQARAALQHAVREREEAAQTRDHAVGERDALLQTGDRLAYERDEAIAARGAALVMRNATRALPGHERHAGWLQRVLAIVVLVGATFALLTVLHVL